MTQEDLVIKKEGCNLVKEKSDLIFELWFTRITFDSDTSSNEDIIELKSFEQNEQWITLSAKEKQDIDKAKEYIKALCNPEVAEIIEIDNNLKAKLNELVLNQLIEQYQVHIMDILGKNLLVQGKKENVMKCLIDLKCKPFCVGSKFEETIVHSTLNEDHVEDNNEDDDILWLENMKHLTPKSYSKMASKIPVDNKKNQVLKDSNQNAQSSSSINEDLEKRFIVIDGSNVAVEHAKLTGKGKCFSCRGIKIACEYFRDRGHKNVIAIIPRFRRGTSDHKCKSVEPEILDELENNGFLSYTPSRFDQYRNKMIFSYDDLFILKAAEHHDAIIVSNDQYRDLQQKNPSWRELVSKNLLQFSFVGDLFMIADDPFGRSGPSIDEFLSKKPSSSSKLNGNGMPKAKSSSKDLNQKHTKKNQTNNHATIPKANSNNNNKDNLNGQETQGAHAAVAFSVNSDESDSLEEKLDENTSGDLFLRLIEMFPDSGDQISELLQTSSKSDINFYIQRLL